MSVAHSDLSPKLNKRGPTAISNWRVICEHCVFNLQNSSCNRIRGWVSCSRRLRLDSSPPMQHLSTLIHWAFHQWFRRDQDSKVRRIAHALGVDLGDQSIRLENRKLDEKSHRKWKDVILFLRSWWRQSQLGFCCLVEKHAVLAWERVSQR